MLLIGYLVSNLSTIEIHLFREVNTGFKWRVNLIASFIIVGGLIYGTYQATHALVNAVSHASKPPSGANLSAPR